MKTYFSLLIALLGLASAINFFTISTYAPEHPRLDSKIINANGRAFVIGATSPSTQCGIQDQKHCPRGVATLVNADMSVLAVAVPGGQVIYVAPDGSISYSVAHSALRPPGSQVGGFYTSQVLPGSHPPVLIISWRSKAGPSGLWACPVSPLVPITSRAVLKASTQTFTGQGCLPVAGLRIQPAGSAVGAWEYT
ncbi:putative secreted protein [Cladobotryum mycophilum]|uniref:Secreted protein n=1 Tax=Cladobotryum mycophilum TaxID=491253 RepID=A0ABR0SWM8_9HYPO